VRAFGIIAAIAIVRFRIKLDQKSLNSSLIFAILSGLACGAMEFNLAWYLVGTYVLLLAGFLIFTILARKYTPIKAEKPSSPALKALIENPHNQTSPDT